MRHYTIGNEPNLNGFWLPQYGPNGENVASPAYLALLAEAYDALKAVSPSIVVLGGALSPRGSDNHTLARHTHSPTKFILDMGTAYKASARTKPVMDALSINPFPDNSSQSPATAHPNGTSIGVADYEKLVKLLGQAFDGTAQKGSTLPIYYGEFGIESVPPAGKASQYNGAEPTTTRPVDEAKQAASYRKALELSFCQPNIAGIFMFLTIDDPRLPGWQSGFYYPDKTAKTSLPLMKQAARQTRGGIVAKCAALKLTPTVDRFGPFGSNGRYGITLRCSIDCTVETSLQRMSDNKVVAKHIGSALARRLLDRAAPEAGARQGRLQVQRRVLGTGEPRRDRDQKHPRLQRPLAFRAWRASTSPTASTGSTRPGGGCRSRSVPPARTPSPRSSRAGRSGWTPFAPTPSRACGRTPTSSSGRSPRATRISASSARS